MVQGALYPKPVPVLALPFTSPESLSILLCATRAFVLMVHKPLAECDSPRSFIYNADVPQRVMHGANGTFLCIS